MSGEVIIFSFTRVGTELNRRMCGMMCRENINCRGYAPEKFAGDGILPTPVEIRELIRRKWGQSTFLFIGAAGIAVRYIAPYVRDKFTDSAVLVMDEKGRYVIPLLSGHMGGAVRMADEIARMTGAQAVHTTATDVQDKFAVDVFARENKLYITDRKMAKEISAAVLEGERIAFCPEYPGCRIEGKIPEELVLCRDREAAEGFRYRIVIVDRLCASQKCTLEQRMDGGDPGGEKKKRKCEKTEGTLLLKPVNVTAGVGCRRGIRKETLKQGLENVLEESGLVPEQVETLASIDLKKDEPALLSLAEEYGIPFVTYPAEELREIEHVTSSSPFVERTTGVDNVCERAALLCCRGGELVRGKSIRESMTAALVRRPVILRMGNR